MTRLNFIARDSLHWERMDLVADPAFSQTEGAPTLKPEGGGGCQAINIWPIFFPKNAWKWLSFGWDLSR